VNANSVRPTFVRWATALAVAALTVTLAGGCGQKSRELQPGNYRAVLDLPGGELPFALDVAQQDGKFVLFLVNGEERVRVSEVNVKDGRLAAKVPGLRTQGCSPAPKAMPPGLREAAAPLINRLFASLPPLVKTTSVGCAPTAAATRCRASSTAWRAARPQPCRLDGLPKRLSSHGSIAASTAGSSGVVALWSR